MAVNRLALAGLGSFVGLLGAVITRPEIPLLGKPPIGAAFGALFSRSEGLDQMYRQAFGQQLAFWIVGGLVVGLILSAVLKNSGSSTGT
jgi:hypothetical protein